MEPLNVTRLTAAICFPGKELFLETAVMQMGICVLSK